MSGPLDAPFAEAETEAGRLRFHQAFAAAPLWLVLEDAPGDALRPRLFPLEAGPTALAFDTEDRLASAFDAPVHHVRMPGRALAAELGPRGVHLALNPGAGGAETVLDAAVLAWIAEVFAAPAEAAEAAALAAPAAPEPALLDGLAARLAALAPAVAEAWLAEAAGGPVLVIRTGEGASAALVEDLARAGQVLTPRPFAVAPAAAGSALLASARRLGIGLLAPAPEAG